MSRITFGAKELYMAAHDEVIAEEMDATGCDEATAYARTADRAWDRMADRMADMGDHYRDLARDREGGVS